MLEEQIRCLLENDLACLENKFEYASYSEKDEELALELTLHTIACLL